MLICYECFLSQRVSSAPTGTDTPGEQVTKQQLSYEQIDSGTLGSEVYLVVETANLRGKKVDIEIFDQEKLLAEDDETAIKVIRDDQETDWINAVKIDDTGKAIVKVKLRKKSDEDYKKQQEALKDDKQARLFLKVTCQSDDRKHKKVFLKPIEEDQYIHPIAFGEHFKLIVGKEDIDLADPSKWMSQFDNPVNPSKACYRTSVIVVGNYGVTSGGLGSKLSETYENGTSKWSNVIQAVIEMPDGSLKNTGDEKKAVDYLDSELEKGNPIVIGVDKEKSETYNKDNTTEHFVVIVGRKTDAKGLYYRFYEVGTFASNKELKGINPNNRLYLQEDNRLVGKKPSSNINYTVTQVRKNIDK